MSTDGDTRFAGEENGNVQRCQEIAFDLLRAVADVWPLVWTAEPAAKTRIVGKQMR